MRDRKAHKPPRAIRYLLFVDRKLQRISVRKLTDRAKTAKQPRFNRPKRAGAASAVGSPAGISWTTIAIGAMTILAAATLMTAGQPSQPTDAASVDAPVANTTPARTPATARASRANASDVARREPPAPESMKSPAVESTAKPAGLKTVPADAAASPGVRNASAAPITIIGCLELDKQRYWLSDTSGTDAPKTRSWRFGFLKKRPARVELVDPAKTLKVPAYVGQRVAGTGTLADGVMRAQSLRSVAAACK